MWPAPDVRAAALVCVLAATVAAQQTETFVAPDGTTFVLAPDPAMPLVHWAVATLVLDPPRYAGLSLATMRSSLAGTWTAGSVDADRERAALDEQDRAWRAWAAAPGDASLLAQLVDRTQKAEGLGDRAAFRRVLAALPVHRPEIVDRYPASVVVLSTVAEAIADVGRALVDRREHVALRNLHVVWPEIVVERGLAQLGDPATRVRAEVLALAMPDHPFGRMLDVPETAMPPRDLAFATWQTTQRPERTVHALVGAFDPEAVKATLQQTFEATALPPSEAPPPVVPRPVTSLRRSVVTGLPKPMVAIAFVLPPDLDRTLLTVTAHWLARGPESCLGQDLLRKGRKTAKVRVEAPWPPTRNAAGMLLVEVEDEAGVDKLADLVLQACRQVAVAEPTASALAAVIAAEQRERTATANDPRAIAEALALDRLLFPKAPVTPFERVDPKAVLRVATRIVSTQPIIVEGRP
ncbi:MAG: insulinase family protein [Planctomycetes bacterium]|nr:insulinase family protein [Planctomycetota bacterium]